jgi:hypothetical protein
MGKFLGIVADTFIGLFILVVVVGLGYIGLRGLEWAVAEPVAAATTLFAIAVIVPIAYLIGERAVRWV